MANLERQAKRPKSPVLAEDVHLLAARALSLLAQQRQPQRLQDRIAWLSDQFISGDPEDSKEAINRVLGDGVTIDDTIDHVLPAVARVLGDRWFADDISFVDVSIGTARLQETVHILRSRERSQKKAEKSGARVLLIVPGPEEHTLGVVIAADQLRRRGLSVDLSVGERPRALAARTRHSNYKLIGITASGTRTVASVKELVDGLRRSAQKFTPIAVGGPIAEDAENVKDRIAADIFTTDICKAALRFGLLPIEAKMEKEPS